MRGFTLIEVMVAMLIAMVALLAIGSFFITVLDQGQVARERLAAVHLAESLLEEWQNDPRDRFPNVRSDCSVRAAAKARPYPVRTSCVATSSPMRFEITANVTPVRGPLPPSPLVIKDFTRPDGFALMPRIKTVKVAWTHKRQSHEVFLMHVTQVK